MIRQSKIVFNFTYIKIRGDLENKINLLGKKLVLLYNIRAKALQREVTIDNSDERIRVSSKYVILHENICCKKAITEIIR